MGKSWDQFRHLDEAEYAREIAHLTPEQLTALHCRIKRKLVTSSMGTAHGVASAPLTGGFSLVAGGVAGRQTNLNIRRLRIIDARIDELQATKYKLRKRDFAVPAAVIGLSAGVASHCEGFFVDHLASENALQAAGVATEMAQEPLYGGVYSHISGGAAASHLAQAAAAGTGSAMSAAIPTRPSPTTVPTRPSPTAVPTWPSPTAIPVRPSVAPASPTLPPRPASADFSNVHVPPADLTGIQQVPALPPRPAVASELVGDIAPALPPRPTSAMDLPSAAPVTSTQFLETQLDVAAAQDRTTLELLPNSHPPAIVVVPPPEDTPDSPDPMLTTPIVIDAPPQDEKFPVDIVADDKIPVEDITTMNSTHAVPPLTRCGEESVVQDLKQGLQSIQTSTPYFPPPPSYQDSIAAAPAPRQAQQVASDVKSPIYPYQRTQNQTNYKTTPTTYVIPRYNPADYV